MKCKIGNCGQILSFDGLLKHFSSPPHNKSRGEELKCIVDGCFRSYTTVKSFVTHLQKNHVDRFSHQLLSSSLTNQVTLLFFLIRQKLRIHDISDTPIHEDISIDHVNLKPAAVESSTIDDEMDTTEFCINNVTKQVSSFFMALRRGGASQAFCDKTNKELRSLLFVLKNLFKVKVTDGSSKQCIEAVYKTVDVLIHSQSSQKKRQRDIEQSPFYISPRSLSCGQEATKRKLGEKNPLTNKELIFEFIPITETLKSLFKSSAFRNTFYEKDHSCTPGIYQGVCCGSLAKSGLFPQLPGKIQVMVQL